ncbi:unnamed protein product [Urochloa humidicola]
MYTTKPLSLFKSNPQAAAEPPPEGRNAGYLVVKAITDDEADDGTTWWGSPRRRVMCLPFPQNRILTVLDDDEDEEAVVFVPVPDQPLASNRYYAVVAKGSRKGLVAACSREEDTATCCFSWCAIDVEPRPFDPADVYQQIEVIQHRRGLFTAKAVADDGVPPSIYRSEYWKAYEPAKTIDFGEAPGLDAELRSRRLGAGPVGKWYCPFFLIREHGVPPREQMGRGAVYEVVLEQRWEQVRGDALGHGRGNSKLWSKKVLIGGSVEAKLEAGRSRHGDAYLWFVAATGERVGVCTIVWERMMWEQSRGGWVNEEEEEAGAVAEADGLVLVERFVVKRMDRSVVVAFDFVHRNKVKVEQGCS